jgi:hypothetical protein
MKKKNRFVGQDAEQAPQLTLSPAPEKAEEAKAEEVAEAPKAEEAPEEAKAEEAVAEKAEEPVVAEEPVEASTEAVEETSSKRSRKKQADSDEG